MSSCVPRGSDHDRPLSAAERRVLRAARGRLAPDSVNVTWLRVFAGENRATAKVGGAFERGLYKLAGVDPTREHDWKHYALAMLAFSLLTQLVTYVVMRLQNGLPFNPTKLANVPPWLAFNTAVSFTTNTNWQSLLGAR